MTTDNQAQAVEALMKLAQSWVDDLRTPWEDSSRDKLRAAIAAALAAERERALEDASALMDEVATWGGSNYYAWHREAAKRIRTMKAKET